MTTRYTQRRLQADLRELGVSSGSAVMLHISVKAVGDVMGGPNTILQALYHVLGADGTLMMYAGWEDIPDFIDELTPEERQIYYDEHPPFDPATSRAVRDNSILAEFLRTWPGTRRSANPEASMIAWGKQADWMTAHHALNYGYGIHSPLARLIELNGQVLLLGSPLDNVTLLHHSENLAKMRHKQIIHYQCPILRDGETVWVDIEDYETGEEHDDYTLGEIVSAYLTARGKQPGMVGAATSYLLDAADLNAFAIGWLEERFGSDNRNVSA